MPEAIGFSLCHQSRRFLIFPDAVGGAITLAGVIPT